MKEVRGWIPAMLGWSVLGGVTLTELHTTVSLLLLIITLLFTGFKFYVAVAEYIRKREKIKKYGVTK